MTAETHDLTVLRERGGGAGAAITTTVTYRGRTFEIIVGSTLTAGYWLEVIEIIAPGERRPWYGDTLYPDGHDAYDAAVEAICQEVDRRA